VRIKRKTVVVVQTCTRICSPKPTAKIAMASGARSAGQTRAGASVTSRLKQLSVRGHPLYDISIRGLSLETDAAIDIRPVKASIQI
jgi:hypothetical protein